MTGPLGRAALFVALFAAPASRVAAADAVPGPAAVEFFEKRVRPVLLQHCVSCHGANEKKLKAGLRLTTRAGTLSGGETGPAVVPGKPDESPLVQSVRYGGDLKMPPKGKLRDDEIAAFTQWVKDGAAWPDAGTEGTQAATPPKTGPLFTDEQKRFWAFQPIQDPTPPVVKNAAVTSPIDAFILAGLNAKGLSPAPPAERRALLRRVTFDLTGLPPTPAEIDAYLADTSPDAFARVVDRLLASPAYGERWGRHWLDVARYADSNGLDENTAFANAWKYRDYVVASLNADKPYDQFVREQLAGDLLPPSADPRVNADRLTATGFLVLGPKLLAEPDKAKMVMDIVDEQIDVASKAFLGLTVSCARCHDHKFDPIPTRDYYALAGVFKSTKAMASLNTVAKAFERPVGTATEEAAAKAHEAKVADLDARAKKLKADIRLAAVAGGAAAVTATKAFDRRLKNFKDAAPPVSRVLAVQDEAKPADVRVHVRGNHLTLGEPAPRVFPRIIAGEAQSPVPATTSGRLELANWVASKANPLTARVIVNRVWQHHFGEGLVRTPDNFGRLGERPTHPELLDWLAARFVADGWSLKALHRRILTTATYQQSAEIRNAELEMRNAGPKVDAAPSGNPHSEFRNPQFVDPDNRLLWKFPRRRLEAEAVRDAMLAVAGDLDRTTGGTLLESKNFEYVTTDSSRSRTRYDSPRRSLYLPVVRNAVFEFFQAFDFVEPHVPTGKRATTVVAPQALFILNNPFVAARSKAFADSLLKPTDVADADRVRAAYPRALARPAAADEVDRALSFLQRYEAALEATVKDAPARRAAAWQAWCHVLFASSEFITLN